jgi:UPF0176 protein
MKSVFAFYKFARVTEPDLLAQQLQEFCDELGVRGTILVAEEGLNGTLCGPIEKLEVLQDRLKQIPGFEDLCGKFSSAEQGNIVFHRMKVKVKPEIVALGVPGVDPCVQTGEHVDVTRWNALLKDPDVLVIDTRNGYEIDIGNFPGAVNPMTSSFREFPEFVQQNLDAAIHPKIAMFCTGGIRCEKASTYMLENGFEQVYQLDGGILKYLESAPEDENMWEGECFIFDQRVSVNKSLQQGQYVQCHACRHPLTIYETQSEHYVPGESCGYCYDTLSEKQKNAFAERQKQVQLAKARGERHIGVSQYSKNRNRDSA